jgi:hypothetical protein
MESKFISTRALMIGLVLVSSLIACLPYSCAQEQWQQQQWQNKESDRSSSSNSRYEEMTPMNNQPLPRLSDNDSNSVDVSTASTGTMSASKIRNRLAQTRSAQQLATTSCDQVIESILTWKMCCANVMLPSRLGPWDSSVTVRALCVLPVGIFVVSPSGTVHSTRGAGRSFHNSATTRYKSTLRTWTDRSVWTTRSIWIKCSDRCWI